MRVNLALATSSLPVKLHARERDFAPASPVEDGATLAGEISAERLSGQRNLCAGTFHTAHEGRDLFRYDAHLDGRKGPCRYPARMSALRALSSA
jgi:hypothetical protein